MTISPQASPQVGISRRRQNLRSAELVANDLDPVCAHCHDVGSAGDVWCQSCGMHLTEQRARNVRPGAWSASA